MKARLSNSAVPPGLRQRSRRFFQQPRSYKAKRGDWLLTCVDCGVPPLKGTMPFVRFEQAGGKVVYKHSGGRCPATSVAKRIRRALGLEAGPKRRRLLKPKTKVTIEEPPKLP